MKALVLGGADCVWRDLRAALDMSTFDLVVAVNAAFRDFPGHVDHAVSYHSDLLPFWTEQRREAGLPGPGKYWSSEGQRHIIGVEMGFVPAWGGSSGLIGAQVGLEVADKVVLCGVPLDPDAAHFDKPGAWDEAVKHRAAWQDHVDDLGRVRSMSGWTAELLGRATEEWLGSE